MPTQEQIERARDAMLRDIGLPDNGQLKKDPRIFLPRLTGLDLLGMSEAALSSAVPTPEEHERGIEAAIKAGYLAYAKDGDAEAQIRAAIAAYLAAAGGK